jgi:hypothetical protein
VSQLQFKDVWILSHVLGASVALIVLMFLHPEVSAFCAPSVCTLIGFTHYWVVRDDKVPDASIP